MKTITIVIAAVLTLQVFSLFASGTDTRSASRSSAVPSAESKTLAPVTPAEATFEDAAVTLVTPVDVVALAPLTPMDVTFEDDSAINSVRVFRGIAPVAPLEADFNDFLNPDNNVTPLAPATPATADFEDLP